MSRSRTAAVALAVLLGCCLAPPSARADEVVLKSGVHVEGVIRRADTDAVLVRLRTGQELRYAWDVVYALRDAPSAAEETIRRTCRDPLAAATAFEKLADNVSEPWTQVRARLHAVQCLLRAARPTDALAQFFRVVADHPDTVRIAATPDFPASADDELLLLLPKYEAASAPAVTRAVAAAIRADLLIAAGRLEDAEAVVATLRDNSDARAAGFMSVRTARIVFARGDVARALNLLNAAERDLGAAFQPDIAWWKARVLLAAGQPDRALLAAAAAPVRYPCFEERAASCLALIAETRDREYRHDEARAAWTWLLRDYPFSPAAARAPRRYRAGNAAGL